MSQVTLERLEKHLWDAADILRGSIDAADYKHYIFGLLFYKRLCDVWWEEYEQKKEEFGEDFAKLPDEHSFHIPEGNFWRDIRSDAEDIGERLNVAFNKIENANPRLEGVFADVDFANKERFPDRLLERLMSHFEEYELTNENVDPNMLGDAYEYLIAKFADDAGKKGGEFYTPKAVVRLMVEVLEPEEGMTVYDPAVGSGGMLLGCWEYLREHGMNPESLFLFGQEKNLNTWAIGKMSLFLHGIEDFVLERGDTLRRPQLLDERDGLRQFDMVLANPPFSLKDWGKEMWKDGGDPFGRDEWGMPPKNYGDWAWIEHMIESVAPGGRMAVVVPHGVLFRSRSEGTIREAVLKDDLVEAVVGLGENLFYGTGIPAAILFINKDKPAERRDKVMIVNGEKEYEEGTNQNHLRDEHVQKLAAAVHEWEDKELLARVVDLEEIEENDYNLNLSRYVQTDPPPPPIDVDAEVEKLRELTAERDAAEDKMNVFLEELGYGE